MTTEQSKRAVTIQDVAATAGVSVSTVSRVLNNKADVAETTVERVRSVIDDLGYSSSLAARSMRSRNTNVIGLILPDVRDPYTVEVMDGVNNAIVELKYDLLIFTNGDILNNRTEAREKQYVALLNNGVADGVIIVTPKTARFSSVSPVVAIDPNVNDPLSPAVISTNLHGAVDATQHLIALGHKRIGYIGGRLDLQSAIRRKQGYLQALQSAGIPVDDTLMVPGDFSTQTAKKSVEQLLALENPPTAIFASNDQSALGVLEKAAEKGLRVPEDLSVVGFDNIQAAGYVNLTTVDQSISDMGYIATMMLFDLIQGKSLDSSQHKIETKLIVRGTTTEAR